MPIKIAVISDTHCYEWEEVHPDMRALVAECDMAIHCGDIVRQSVVEGFLKSAKNKRLSKRVQKLKYSIISQK